MGTVRREEWEDDPATSGSFSGVDSCGPTVRSLVEREHCTMELSLNPGCQLLSAVALCKSVRISVPRFLHL